MARKRKRFGDSQEVHRERSKGTLREMKRLRRLVLSRMKKPAMCADALDAAMLLAQQSGAYLIDRSAGSSRAGFGGRGVSRLLHRVVKACAKPTAKSARRIYR